MRKVLAGAVIVVVSLFVMSVPVGLAQDACEGNFDCDQDVDGTDAAILKADFGRSQFNNPCDACYTCPSCEPVCEPCDTCSSSGSGYPAPVPKTGQTTVYGPRDDGYWQQAVGIEWPNPRFTENGDGTVTDNLTGLIWLKNADCFGLRNWNDALSDSNGLSAGWCGLTDGSSPGDWRLPNYKEFVSLVDLENNDPALQTGHPFINVQTGPNYWSSNTNSFNINLAWYVSMYNGKSGFGNKVADSYYVWPVRGGQ